MFDLLIIIGTAIVTGTLLLLIWPIARWLRPARAYDLDTAHVALAIGRRRSGAPGKPSSR